MARIKRLDHIGIAVRNPSLQVELFKSLGLSPNHVEVVADQKVRTVFIPLGEVSLELLEPTDQDSPVAKFLSKRGGGVHHLCFEVDDLEEALAELKSSGYRLIDEKPRLGAYDKRIAFLHPATGDGLLIELCEAKKS